MPIWNCFVHRAAVWTIQVYDPEERADPSASSNMDQWMDTTDFGAKMTPREKKDSSLNSKTPSGSSTTMPTHGFHNPSEDEPCEKEKARAKERDTEVEAGSLAPRGPKERATNQEATKPMKSPSRPQTQTRMKPIIRKARARKRESPPKGLLSGRATVKKEQVARSRRTSQREQENPTNLIKHIMCRPNVLRRPIIPQLMMVKITTGHHPPLEFNTMGRQTQLILLLLRLRQTLSESRASEQEHLH